MKNITIATIFIKKKHIPFIQDEMGKDKINILHGDDDSVKVEIILTNDMDVLNLFYAGIKYGSDLTISTLKSSSK